jgi:hypothetical protein
MSIFYRRFEIFGILWIFYGYQFCTSVWQETVTQMVMEKPQRTVETDDAGILY